MGVCACACVGGSGGQATGTHRRLDVNVLSSGGETAAAPVSDSSTVSSGSSKQGVLVAADVPGDDLTREAGKGKGISFGFSSRVPIHDISENTIRWSNCCTTCSASFLGSNALHRSGNDGSV
jgi:hypothetical protein